MRSKPGRAATIPASAGSIGSCILLYRKGRAGMATYSSTIVAATRERMTERTASVPWYIWCAVAATTSGVIGGVWDISWHESVGRDTFWTPAHVLIYLCGILAGISCGYLILATTLQKQSALRSVSVDVWHFRAPLGAFICAWGGVAMITSAPFDNWWHNAYGLDVKILSPPHILLALGLAGIRFGALVLILAELNRATGRLFGKMQILLFYMLVLLMGLTVGIAQELTNRVFMHSAKFYLVVCLAAPLWFAVVGRVAKHRWAATIMTGIYTALHLTFLWILPLFPAEPKLGPVFQKLTHLIPPDFPMLLIVPAIAYDVVRRRGGAWNRWAQAVTLGTTFLVTFFAVQWPFANFLMSPASRNWFFATNEYPYFIPSNSPWVRNVFVTVEHSSGEFWMRLAVALAVAVVMLRIGFSWGEWMKRLRR